MGKTPSPRHAWRRPDSEPQPVSTQKPVRVCIDLTPNETIDRHGGIGRYGYYLLEQLLELPEVKAGQVEVVALPVSTEGVVSAEEALERAVLSRPAVHVERHRRNRQIVAGMKLRAGGVDLFHAVQPVALPLLMGCKLVCTIHDLIPIVYPSPYKRRYKHEYRRLREMLDWGVRVARADHLIAISQWTARDLVDMLHVPESKITTVYHGVDTQLFSTRPGSDAATIRKYALPPRGFLCVSSDHYRKNHRILFEAWCNRASEMTEGLVFVGHAIYGSTLNEILDEVQKRGLTDRFRWLPDVGDSELPAIYRWATATVAPSLYEGFGMTLIESMACGTPVAVARNGVYEEVGGSAVVHFDGRSVESLEQVLLSLSQDARLRARLTQRGLERAQRFTWRRTAEATLAVYKHLLTPSSARLALQPL